MMVWAGNSCSCSCSSSCLTAFVHFPLCYYAYYANHAHHSHTHPPTVLPLHATYILLYALLPRIFIAIWLARAQKKSRGYSVGKKKKTAQNRIANSGVAVDDYKVRCRLNYKTVCWPSLYA